MSDSILLEESRASERLIAPPRSAVAVPGRRSGLRDLGRRLWEVRQALGFFGVFWLAGGSIFLFGLAGTVGPWRESLRENGDPRFFLVAMAFGTVFLLVSARMFQVVLAGEASEGRRRRRGDRSKPWASDHPWRPEAMPPDYSSDRGGAILGRLAILSFIALFNLAWASGEWIFRGIILLLDVFALAIVYDAITQTANALRFGRPRVRWLTFPAFTGGRLEGVLQVPRVLRPTGPVRVTLRCVEDRRSSDQFEPWVVYSQVRELAAEGPWVGSLRFELEVPADLPGNHLSRQEANYWQVVFRAPVAGPDFEAVFLAPVYEKRKGKAAGAAA
jgi:hypothetical protein